MIVFADTSGLYAYLVRNDLMHVRAKSIFQSFAAANVRLLTSSYVLLETTALLQHRVDLAAAFDFRNKIQPLLDIVWVDAEWHEKALNRLVALNQKKVSLVDCLSFAIMEAREIKTVFGFDSHFKAHGFSLAQADMGAKG